MKNKSLNSLSKPENECNYPVYLIMCDTINEPEKTIFYKINTH